MKHLLQLICSWGTTLVFGVVLSGNYAAVADDGQSKTAKEIVADSEVNCALYRAKREAVPIYAEASTSSQVLDHLSLGERVCHVGEQGDFAIVDWRQQDGINRGRERSKKEYKGERVFARLVDLWPARDRSSKGIVDDTFRRMQDYYYYWRYGGVPDDVFGPVRPLVRPLDRGPTCEAGKICSEVRQKVAEQKSEAKAQQQEASKQDKDKAKEADEHK